MDGHGRQGAAAVLADRVVVRRVLDPREDRDEVLRRRERQRALLALGHGPEEAGEVPPAPRRARIRQPPHGGLEHGRAVAAHQRRQRGLVRRDRRSRRAVGARTGAASPPRAPWPGRRRAGPSGTPPRPRRRAARVRARRGTRAPPHEDGPVDVEAPRDLVEAARERVHGADRGARAARARGVDRPVVKAKRRPSARRVGRRASPPRPGRAPSRVRRPARDVVAPQELRRSHELRAHREPADGRPGRRAARSRAAEAQRLQHGPARRRRTRAGSSTWWSASRSSSPLTPTNHGAAFRSSWTARSATTAAGWWTTIGSVGGDFWGRRGLAPRKSTGWGLLPTAMPFDRCALRHYACEKRFDAMLPFARAFYGCRASATMQGPRNTRARSSFDTMLPFCELSELF